MLKKIIQFFKLVLMLLLLPLFFWGPFTHPYINILAHREAKNRFKKGDKKINPVILEAVDKHPESFYFGGNSPDAIAINNILTGISVYDYTHNYNPDNAWGIPEFGYRLIREWEEGKYPIRELSVACGWLSHQVADWFAHHAAIDTSGNLLDEPLQLTDGINTFSGYSNSHRVFGVNYHREILNQYTLTEHAIIEFFHDLILYHRYGLGPLKDTRVELFSDYPQGNLLTDTSEKYKGVAARIAPELLSGMKENFTFIIGGLELLMHLFITLRPQLPGILYSIYKDGLIKQAADHVLKKVFCYSQRELSLEILDRNPKVLSPIKVINIQRSGTILFPIVHGLGSIIDPKALIPYISGVPIRFSLLWGLLDIRLKFISTLIRLLTTMSLEKLAKDENAGELISFFSKLLVDRSGDLKRPLENFRSSLKPLIKLYGDPNKTKKENLYHMLGQRNISFRAYPPIYYGSFNNASYKALDPESLTLRINGYNVRKENGDFALNVYKKDDILDIKCRIFEGIPPGPYHIYFDIKDLSGVTSNKFDYELNIRY